MSFFKRIFVSIILFFALHTLHSAAEVVNKVEVQGNERISKETVMGFGDIVIGKDYERSDISLLSYWRSGLHRILPRDFRTP